MQLKPAHSYLFGFFLSSVSIFSCAQAQETNLLSPQSADPLASSGIELKQEEISPSGDAPSETVETEPEEETREEEKSTAASPVIPTPEKKISGKGVSLAAQISKATKEREQRMLAMNEAMMQLTQAGAEDEATKLERRLKAMIETRDPREDDAVLANKAELDLLKQSVADLTAEVSKLSAVLAQNSRIMDEILRKAVPDVSPAVMDELRNSGKKAEIRKAP